MEIDVAQLGPQHATRSGPKSFNDTSVLKGGDERTEHIPDSLFIWECVSRTRTKAPTKEQTMAVEIFIELDEKKIQPSWVRQWISLVYSPGPKDTNEDNDDDCRSTLSLSTDSTFDGPSTMEAYTLFLKYYSKLKIDQNDSDGSALRILNAERKRMGIMWALERVDEDEGDCSMSSDVDMIEESNIEAGGSRDEGPWRCGENISGDTTANYPTEYDQRNMDVDTEVDPGVVAMLEVSPLASLSDFAAVTTPDTPATGKMSFERTDLFQCDDEEIPTYKNPPTHSPSTPVPVAISATNAHPDSSMQDGKPSSSVSLASTSTSQMDVASMERFDSTMEDAGSLHSIHSTTTPSTVYGPCSIYDLDSILSPPVGIETAHIREKLLRWKRLDWPRRGGAVRRPTRQEDFKSEILKGRISRELGFADAKLVQPSWASQWIQFILNSHDPHSRHLIVYDASFVPLDDHWALLLQFFALLMDYTHESRNEALTLLNNKRKDWELGFTLELPRDMAREFKSSGAAVDLDTLMQIEQMAHPISWEDMLLDGSFMDSGGGHAMIGEGFGPKRKTSGPKRRTTGGRGHVQGRDVKDTQPKPEGSTLEESNGFPPWKRPEPLPVVEPAPVSSNPADLTSKYMDMLMATGKPEPQTRHVWAKTRADLCETAPYFRSAQAGIHVDKTTRMIGYLLDGFPSPGDIWAKEGRLIVSHGGGGSQVEETTASVLKKAKTRDRIVHSSSVALPRHVYDQSDGMHPSKNTQSKPKNVALGSDQSRGNSSIRNLIKAKELGVPVILLVGSNYRWWPLKMVKDGKPNQSSNGIDDEEGRGRYAVLGWYRVKDTWEELEPGSQSNDQVSLFIRRKFTFEWVEGQGVPWWLTDMEEAHSNWLSQLSVPEIIPSGASSPLSCVSEPAQFQQISALDLWSSECSEDPPGLQAAVVDPLTLGYKCAKCLMISPIIYHDGWFCTNSQCSQIGLLLDGRFATELTLSYSQDFIDRPTLPQPALIGIDKNDVTEFLAPIPEGWPVGWSVIPRYREDLKTYERVHWNGRCCAACGRMNSKVQWNVWTCATCDKIIERSSDTIYPLEEFLGPGTKGRVKMPTLLLDCADDLNTCVLYAHLENGGDIYVIRTKSPEPFESMFKDFQQQARDRDMFRRSPLKINYVSGLHTKHFQHNAGVPYNFSCEVTTESFEEGPPVVKQARDLLEETASRILHRNVEFNEVLSCAYKKEQSMRYHSDDEIGVQGTIAALSLGSPALMTFRPKLSRIKDEEANGETKEEGKKRVPVLPPPCLGFHMQHGDILIMDGIGIQQNYQHQVIPEGLRFAATARLIERPKGKDGIQHPRQWKVTQGRRKNLEFTTPNPPRFPTFPSSSFAETPAATPVKAEPILDFGPAFNTATLPSNTTPSMNPYTNAHGALPDAEASVTFNPTTMTNSYEPLKNDPDFLFHTTATPINED